VDPGGYHVRDIEEFITTYGRGNGHAKPAEQTAAAAPE
jgi:hypothetical protein